MKTMTFLFSKIIFETYLKKLLCKIDLKIEPNRSFSWNDFTLHFSSIIYFLIM